MKHAPLSPWGVKTQLVVGNVRVLAADGVLGLGERRLSIHLCKKRHVGQLDGRQVKGRGHNTCS